MIQEDYVTFEQAKVLKELGFPQETTYYYLQQKAIIGDNEIPNEIGDRIHCCYDTEELVKCCACPTFSLVQKWLREEKELYIEIYYVDINNYGISICTPDYQHDADTYIPIEGTYPYETAVSVGIDKCIEILKNK